MKKIFFLTVFALHISLFCFSQTDSMQHYTDAEINKLSKYIKELENKNPAVTASEPNASEKKQVDQLLNDHAHVYTNTEIIKFAAYIKTLEKANGIAVVSSEENALDKKPIVNDSLHAYSLREINKFNVYIKDLEKRNLAATGTEYNTEQKNQIADLLNSPTHVYTDVEIIKLAQFIKSLQKQDSLNVIVIAANIKKARNDSMALLAAQVTDPGKEYHLDEEKEIDKFEKVIFFNFNSASLKEESNKPLDAVVSILKMYVNLNFVVEGYCDSVGAANYNLVLSQKRAEAVKKYFISKGIPASRISSRGYGKGRPKDTNTTESGRANNRRVEIKAKRREAGN